MSRWFFQNAVNFRSYSVFESSEYSEDQGYATKAEAVDAAIAHVQDLMNAIASDVHYKIQQLSDYSKERANLEGMRNEKSKNIKRL
jgi:hypothetical protein